MPFLRFIRDSRGYESTAIVHTVKRRGRGRSRILYWFRSPPNVRVGRAPLDEDAIRSIEESNPNLTFDWNKILEARVATPPVEGRRSDRRPQRRVRTVGPAPAAIALPMPDEEMPPLEPVEVDADEGDQAQEALSNGEAEESGGEPIRLAVSSPVETLVGSEGLARLRARHAELLARIGDRPRLPLEVEGLRQQAAELDPDSWVTLDEARAALETYERRLEALRQVLGPPRRRSRRGGARRRRGRGRTAPPLTEAGAPGAAAEAGSHPGPEASDGPETPNVESPDGDQ